MKKALLLKILFITYFIFDFNVYCFAQTLDPVQVDLNTKYWSMRNRFRKYFISIGSGKGQGIPMAWRQNVDRCNFYSPGSSGTVFWGDATSYIGDYLCTLATEYYLLKKDGRDTKATLNELYYAINAINRLDDNAEPTFNSTFSKTRNGFFLRDDIDQTTISTWTNQYAGSNDPWLNYKCYDADRARNLDAWNFTGNVVDHSNRCTNEMSLDQVCNLLMGFRFINLFVDNTFVQPTSSDLGFKINDEVNNITNNIIDYLSTERVLKTPDHSSEYVWSVLNPINKFILGAPGSALVSLGTCADGDVRSNWVIVNPTDGRKVGVCSNDTKGQEIRPFAYPIARAAEKINGHTDYVTRDIHHKVVDQIGDNIPCIEVHDYHIALPTMDNLVWQVLEQATTFPNEFTVVFPGFPLFNIKPAAFTWEPKFSGTLARNFYLFESLATTSGTWSHQNVVKFSDFYGHSNMDLCYSLINFKTPLKNQTYYESLLTKMDCQGPHKYGVLAGQFTPYWHKGNNFEIPEPDTNLNPDSYYFGDYNANDWMWMYNMYRIAFSSSINAPPYEDKSCNCVGNKTIYSNINSSNFLTSNITVKRIFPNYKDFSIYLSEYINSNINTQNKNISNNTTLIICNNALVEVDNGGKIENLTTTDPKDSIQLIVRSGTLRIKSGGQLVVGANTKVIVEPGAKLEIQKGGKLIINDNSKAIVQRGGQFILEPNTEVQLKGANSLLDVQDVNTTITLANSGEQILFTNAAGNSQGGTAQFAGGDFSHSGTGKFIIENCTARFLYSNSNTQMTYHYGFKADLQLQGDKSILDLQGNLFIGNGCKFSFTWPGNNKHGFVKFSRPGYWGGNAVPHIIVGKLGGCSFELIGTGINDKMMEVAQETVYMPDNLSFLFTAKNSKIEFTVPQARLQVPCDYDIFNDLFICPNLSSLTFPPRGLTVFGQNNKPINNCTFNNFYYDGLNAELFYGGNKLFLNNCLFTNASALVNGKGADITQCNFTKGYLPLEFIGSTFNSNIKNCSFSSNEQHIKGYADKTPITGSQRYFEYSPLSGLNGHLIGGVGIFGGASGPVLLNIDNCDIRGFEVGVEMDGQGVANIKCGAVKNNDFGVALYSNAKVYMSSTSPLNINSQAVTGGFVDAEDNGITIFSAEGSEINILNGFNNLKTNTQGNPWGTVTVSTGPGPNNNVTYTTYTANPVIYGKLVDVGCANTPSLVPADKNYWKNNHSTLGGQYLVDSTSIIFFDDCSVQSNFSGNRVYFQDLFSTELSKNQLPGCGSGPCLTCRTTPIQNCSNCSSINTSQIGITQSNNAALAADNSALQNTTVSNKKAISLHSDILKSNIRTTGSTEDKYVNKYSHHRLHQTFADAYEQNQIPDSLPNQPDLVNAIQALDAQITPLNIGSDYNNTIYTLLEKGQLYRMARLRHDALTTFNQALALANTQEHIDYINKWICLTTIEIDALANPDRKGEFSAKLDSCSGRRKIMIPSNARFNQNGNNPESSIENMNESELSGYELKVYPNPSSGELFISYKFEEVGMNEFIITDVAGKNIATIKLLEQSSLIKANYKELESGIYFYQLKQNGKTIKADKLIIAK